MATNTTDIITLVLQIPQNSIPPISKYDYESVFGTMWTLQYHVHSNGEKGSVVFGRTGEYSRGLTCICDVTGPESRHYLEYFFGQEDVKCIQIPLIDLASISDPVTITCRVMTKAQPPLPIGLDEEKTDMWTEKNIWNFPRGLLDKPKWCTGFKVDFRSGNYHFDFVVMLNQDGTVYIDAPEKSPAHLYMRGVFLFGTSGVQTFRVVWLKDERRKVLCRFEISSTSVSGDSPLVSLKYKLYMATDPNFIKMTSEV